MKGKGEKMVKYTEMSTRKMAIAISTTLVVAVIVIATTTPILGATHPATVNNEAWAERAAWALTKAKRAMDYAIDKIVEQVESGKNVTLAKNTLKASIIIYGAAERTLVKATTEKPFSWRFFLR